MNKKLVKEVLKLMPELCSVEHYFYERPVDHILRGFLCERGTGGVYVWKYAFPLYDHFEFLHLGYGERLPGSDGFIEVKCGGEKEIALELVRRIAAYRSEVEALADLEKFIEYIEEELPLDNPIFRRGYATTLIMLGRDDQAKNELEILKDLEPDLTTPEFRAVITRLLSDLSVSLSVAKETLIQWEQKTKHQLGISHNVKRR